MTPIAIPSPRFRVKVTRYEERPDGTQSWFGSFESRVFAMTHDRFLVYDPGDFNASEGFCWVDFTKMMPDMSKSMKNWEEEPYLPTVELIEE